MANPTANDKGRDQHSTEVFEEEIENLEKSRTVKSWSSWLAGLGAVTLLLGIVLLVMAYDVRTHRPLHTVGNVSPVRLDQPTGDIDHLPSAFRWGKVEGVTSYLVTVWRGDGDEVVLVRPSLGESLSPSADDLSVFSPGKYRWTVDARGSDGKTKAYGEGTFHVKM
jgi:hypothetical protein